MEMNTEKLLSCLKGHNVGEMLEKHDISFISLLACAVEAEKQIAVERAKKQVDKDCISAIGSMKKSLLRMYQALTYIDLLQEKPLTAFDVLPHLGSAHDWYSIYQLNLERLNKIEQIK
jgi:hypothetical protein